MKTFKIILIALVFLGALICFIIWYAFRTSSEDISTLSPFQELVGTELSTVQPCFIALNYEPWVKENPYILVMGRKDLSAKAKNIQNLPIGSTIKITSAKRFTNSVTGFKSTYLLGTIFLKESQEEIRFEFAWGSKNFGTDLKGDYFSYALAPWQEKPLNLMYNYDEGTTAPYQNFNIEHNAKD